MDELLRDNYLKDFSFFCKSVSKTYWINVWFFEVDTISIRISL